MATQALAWPHSLPPRLQSTGVGGGGWCPAFWGFPEPSRYGAPGVEFMGLHKENNAVMQIHFLPGQVSTCFGEGLGGEGPS